MNWMGQLNRKHVYIPEMFSFTCLFFLCFVLGVCTSSINLSFFFCSCICNVYSFSFFARSFSLQSFFSFLPVLQLLVLLLFHILLCDVLSFLLPPSFSSSFSSILCIATSLVSTRAVLNFFSLFFFRAEGAVGIWRNVRIDDCSFAATEWVLAEHSSFRVLLGRGSASSFGVFCNNHWL